MWLTNEQLDNLCDGITREQKTRRVKFLRALGLNVIVTPSGAPMVLCSNVEAVVGGLPAASGKPAVQSEAKPDADALRQMFGNKRKRVAA
jgi:hypothetical protein